MLRRVLSKSAIFAFQFVKSHELEGHTVSCKVLFLCVKFGELFPVEVPVNLAPHTQYEEVEGLPQKRQRVSSSLSQIVHLGEL